MSGIKLTQICGSIGFNGKTMTILEEWLEEFNSLEKSRRARFASYPFEEAVAHLQRDMDWIMEKLKNDPYAQLQMKRIKFHIIGLVQKEIETADIKFEPNDYY